MPGGIGREDRGDRLSRPNSILIGTWKLVSAIRATDTNWHPSATAILGLRRRGAFFLDGVKIVINATSTGPVERILVGRLRDHRDSRHYAGPRRRFRTAARGSRARGARPARTPYGPCAPCPSPRPPRRAHPTTLRSPARAPRRQPRRRSRLCGLAAGSPPGPSTDPHVS